jgi:hypothetical protein
MSALSASIQNLCGEAGIDDAPIAFVQAGPLFYPKHSESASQA